VKISQSFIQNIQQFFVQRGTDKEGLNIVFDITNDCNLACVGCCVNARLVDSNYVKRDLNEITTQQAFDILERIRSYANEQDESKVYINFGGGEPFIRDDFLDIVRYTRKIMPSSTIAVDTNGTLGLSKDYFELLEIADIVGFSVDGLRESHNKWRKPKNHKSGFDKTISTIKHCLTNRKLADKIEVTCVANRGNLNEILSLVRYLDQLGVAKFSIHRGMQVGRFLRKSSQIPDAIQYLELTKNLLTINSELNIKVSMHHSLMAIYGALYANLDTQVHLKKYGKSNLSSSIAIDSYGQLHIDPWLTSSPWSKLSLGSTITNELQFLLSERNPLFWSLKQKTDSSTRCNGCAELCSGGSRIAAASYKLTNSIKSDHSITELLNSLSAIDPACPKFLEIKSEKDIFIKEIH
jgi:MoaA/NifB/PqqE/SkfB family radical SAM enzyme